MSQKIERKKFIKLGLLGVTGTAIGCKETDSPTEKETKELEKDTISTEQIEQIQPPDYFYTSGEQYDKTRLVFNKGLDKHPAIVAQCKNAEEVSTAIKFAVQEKLKVTVKSGGHSFEGFSVNDGGLVVDVSKMKQIEWLELDQIKVGAGCTLGYLNDNLLPRKRLLPAGSCSGVGIAGLALAGGYGFFAREHGLTCDQIVELTLVDAKGTIQKVKGDSDLLWACRGAGIGNFGVVTDITFKTHSAPSYMQSHRFKAYKLDAERAKSLMKAWFKATENLPRTCFGAFVLNGKTLTILVTNYGPDSEYLNDCLAMLEPITDKATTGSKIPLARALKTFYGIQTPVYFKNGSAGLYEDFNDVEPFILSVCEEVISTPGMIYQINTLGGKINEPVLPSAYPHRSKNYLSELQTYWDQPNAKKRLVDQFVKVQEIFYANGIQTQYANYPALEFEDWPTAYYGSNYSKLRKIKRELDPDQIFDYAQSIKV